MKNLKSILWGAFALLLTGGLLIGCARGAPATPTTDPSMILTQVAETVMASITQTAAAMPTNTPIPTNTPVPTPIPLPTEDLNVIPTSVTSFNQGVPTATPQRYGNWAKWYGQSPSDGQTFTAYQKITFHGCMRNVGDTVWNSNFYLLLVSGPNLWGTKTTWRVGTATSPGQVWCWDMYPATMPATKGTFTSRFYFYTDQGVKFFGDGEVFFTYNVG